MASICNDIYSLGYLEGIGTDVAVSAFGKKKNLHRIILCQSSYFKALFCGSWRDSDDKKFVLKFDDHYITADAFHIVIGKLYGRLDYSINEKNALNLLVTANYFDLKDFAQDCTDFFLRNLGPETIISYLNLSDSHPHTDIDYRGCFAAFCREGHDTLKNYWSQLPPFWMFVILCSDAFWVPTEYERYLFVRDLSLSHKTKMQRKKLHDRTSQASTETLYHVLDFQDIKSQSSTTVEDHLLLRDQDIFKDEEDTFSYIFDNRIRYQYMTYEQEIAIQNDRNPETGLAYVDSRILHKALWQQVELRVEVIGSSSTRVYNGEKKTLSIREPFRFSVEFKAVKDSTNQVSSAFFYAGSTWRVKVEDSKANLGIFLQRQ